jgi:hypothetical protein
LPGHDAAPRSRIAAAASGAYLCGMALIRLALRTVGFLLIAAAYAVFVIDSTRVIAGGPLVAAPFEVVVAALDPGAALAAPVGWLWQWLLGAPAFAVLGLAGIVLMLLGRRPRKSPLAAAESWRA